MNNKKRRNLSKELIKLRLKTWPATLDAVQDRTTRKRREEEVGLNGGGDN